MDKIYLNSDNIYSVEYITSSSLLFIEFNRSGLYQYEDVPFDVYMGLVHASSPGTYFHEHIKGKYSYKKGY